MKKILSVTAALSALFVLIFASAQAVAACRSALSLCSELIIPRLFPFFVLSGLLNALGLPQMLGSVFKKSAERLFKVSGVGFSAFFMGICGGYPLGAASIADMMDRGIISDREAERLLIFCNNTGPAFIIGALGGGVFKSAKVGLLLYIIHIISALICGLLLAGEERLSSSLPLCSRPVSFPKALTVSVQKAVINMLNVCGFIVSFGIFLGLLEAGGLLPALCTFLSERTGFSPQYISALFKGSIELGSGIAAMQGLPFTPRLYALAAFILGFGSLSVHFQTMALFADKNIKCAPHLMGRILSATIAAIFAYITAGMFL